MEESAKTGAKTRHTEKGARCSPRSEAGGRWRGAAVLGGEATAEFVAQLNSALSTSVADSTSGPVVVAYEPQWAIGAAEPASPQHITTVCAALRAHLAKSPFTGSQVIYGGSAKPGLLTQLTSGVDGLFLGRFAHDPSAVATILDEVVDLALFYSRRRCGHSKTRA